MGCPLRNWLNYPAKSHQGTHNRQFEPVLPDPVSMA